jgi:hypothetical protein
MPMKMASGGGDNASDKYLRNKIRHDLVPLFKALIKIYSILSKNTVFLQNSKW